MHTIDLVAADAAATRGSVEVVAKVVPADLDRPTPCADWDLRALLAHMTVQHRGFAAAAGGRGSDPTGWQPVDWPDPGAAYTSAAAEVLTAFAAPDIVDRDFVLPEIPRAPSFPGRIAIGFHLVDYVVHGWDVARTLGLAYQPAPEVLAATLPIARAVPDGPSRLAPGAAFAPGRARPADPAPLDEILLLLGRDPRWTAPKASGRDRAGRPRTRE
jgi:uncharacterized protein (TIGR03086 family)